MQQNQFSPNQITEEKKNPLFCVTPFSKYLAMMLFIILPFLGGYVGYVYAPEKVVEVERIIHTEKRSDQNLNDKETSISRYQFVVDIEDENWNKPWPIFSTSTVSLFDGTEYHILYQANEKCTVTEEVPDVLVETNARSEFMSNFISASDQISMTASCWVAGGGYELYLINAPNSIQVIGFTVNEVGPNTGLSPFGAVEVLYP